MQARFEREEMIEDERNLGRELKYVHCLVHRYILVIFNHSRDEMR